MFCLYHTSKKNTFTIQRYARVAVYLVKMGNNDKLHTSRTSIGFVRKVKWKYPSMLSISISLIFNLKLHLKPKQPSDKNYDINDVHNQFYQ